MSAASNSITEGTEWVICTACRAMIYRKRWLRNLSVCPGCGKHSALDARSRLESLADPGSLRLIDPPRGVVPDVLNFVDTVPYPQRLAEARARTGLESAVLSGIMSIEDSTAVVAAMDFAFLGGSLGALAGAVLVEAAHTAIDLRVPLIAVTASGGARMQEGAISLMQMAKTSAAWAELDEAGLLTVSVVTDPTYGGVAASFATLSDVIVGEIGARLGFAGRRVIEQTIRQKLPENFQTVEFLQQRGFVDIVTPRAALRSVLGRLLRIGHAASASPRPTPPRASAPIVRDPGLLAETEPWRQVRQARDIARPTTREYINLVCHDFVELHGDRASGDCPAIVSGLARLDSWAVAVIGHQKGHTPQEIAEHNFGMPNPAGYRKAARVMRLAAKLRMPVVTLVDTPGAFPGERAEDEGQAWAISENLRLMASLPVPVVSVVTGEGGSGGALGIAVANRVLIWEHAIYSVISPEGCASILFKDPALAPAAAAALGLCARDLLRLGIVDGVLPEPSNGIGAEPATAAQMLRDALLASLAELAGLAPNELIGERRARFARFGRPAIDAVDALVAVDGLPETVH